MILAYTVTENTYTARVYHNRDRSQWEVGFGWMEGAEFRVSPTYRARTFKTEAGALRAAHRYVAERVAAVSA